MAIIRIGSESLETGEKYLKSLYEESDRNFRILLSLLSSYWQSTVDGPFYARELKSMAIELSRVRLMMSEIRADIDWRTTRTEFLHQFVTSMLFSDSFGSPDLQKSDVEFRSFLENLVKAYFKGSTPISLQEILSSIIGSEITIKENFELAKIPGSSYDISDQFGFSIDVNISNPSDMNSFLLDRNVKILLSTIRPAHTLYKLRFVINDALGGNTPPTRNPFTDISTNKISDSFQFMIASYSYEDFRKFVSGVYGVDPSGSRKSHPVFGEDHTGEF